MTLVSREIGLMLVVLAVACQPHEGDPPNATQPATPQADDVSNDHTKTKYVLPFTEKLVLDGRDAKALQVALEAFAAAGGKVTQYRVELYHRDAGFSVLFHSPDRAPSARGSGRGLPSFGVDIDDGLAVKNASFQR